MVLNFISLRRRSHVLQLLYCWESFPECTTCWPSQWRRPGKRPPARGAFLAACECSRPVLGSPSGTGIFYGTFLPSAWTRWCSTGASEQIETPCLSICKKKKRKKEQNMIGRWQLFEVFGCISCDIFVPMTYFKINFKKKSRNYDTEKFLFSQANVATLLLFDGHNCKVEFFLFFFLKVKQTRALFRHLCYCPILLLFFWLRVTKAVKLLLFVSVSRTLTFVDVLRYKSNNFDL